MSDDANLAKKFREHACSTTATGRNEAQLTNKAAAGREGR
jgi:hypothetical protein